MNQIENIWAIRDSIHGWVVGGWGVGGCMGRTNMLFSIPIDYQSYFPLNTASLEQYASYGLFHQCADSHISNTRKHLHSIFHETNLRIQWLTARHFIESLLSHDGFSERVGSYVTILMLLNSSPPGKKWSPFRRWYFQMHCRLWKVLDFYEQNNHWSWFLRVQLTITQHWFR